MIVDTSAIISILREELGYRGIERSLVYADYPRVGAPTHFETELVLMGRYGAPGRGMLARFLDEYEVTVVPFSPRHAFAASDAFLRYGKGRHPAALNYGDCLAYAVARVERAPLLCVGNDFAQTDLELVLTDAG